MAKAKRLTDEQRAEKLAWNYCTPYLSTKDCVKNGIIAGIRSERRALKREQTAKAEALGLEVKS